MYNGPESKYPRSKLRGILEDKLKPREKSKQASRNSTQEIKTILPHWLDRSILSEEAVSGNDLYPFRFSFVTRYSMEYLLPASACSLKMIAIASLPF
jgi:hypothetical protein